MAEIKKITRKKLREIIKKLSMSIKLNEEESNIINLIKNGD